MTSRVIGEAFGAYTSAAVEGMELDVRREYNDCNMCDLTVYGRCNVRAWGGEHPAPRDIHTVVENRPWTCTREFEHEGEHTACAEGSHELFSWGDSDCLPGAACKMFTAKLLVEAAGLNMKGKFVRRPPLEQLLGSQAQPDHPFPVDREEPRVDGGVTLFVYNRGTQRMTGVDVTEEFSEHLPILYLTEGDLMTAISREHGEKFAGSIELETREWTDEGYQMMLFTAQLLSEMQPSPGGYPEKILAMVGAHLLEYEKKHFMAS